MKKNCVNCNNEFENSELPDFCSEVCYEEYLEADYRSMFGERQ